MVDSVSVRFKNARVEKMPLDIRIQWNAGTARVSEWVFQTLACRGLRGGPSKVHLPWGVELWEAIMVKVLPLLSRTGKVTKICGYHLQLSSPKQELLDLEGAWQHHIKPKLRKVATWKSSYGWDHPLLKEAASTWDTWSQLDGTYQLEYSQQRRRTATIHGIYSKLFIGLGMNVTWRSVCERLHVGSTGAGQLARRQLVPWLPCCCQWCSSPICLSSESKNVSFPA